MHVGLSCLAFAVAWLAWKVIYLAFLHPCAKYPGPFIAKFSYIYAGYHGWKGDVQIDHLRCHKKYGPIVRYGPNQILFNTHSALKDIFGTAVSTKFTKSKHFGVLALDKHSTLTHPGGPDHLRRRRILSQNVGDQAQREYQPRIIEHVNQFLDTVCSGGSAQWGKPFDMGQWADYLTFDLMTDLIYGAKYNLLGNEKFRYVVDMIEKTNVRNSALIQCPALLTCRIDKYLFPASRAASRRFLKFLGRLLHDRGQLRKGNKCGIYQNQPIVKDVYTSLEMAEDPVTKQGFTPEELASESATLIFAGSDTTACALAATLFYLADNDHAYNRVREEIHSQFSSRSEICLGPALSSCHYLRACIDESLRMSPPVGTGNGRETPANGITIDGEFLPANIDVGVSTYAIHHNEDYYSDPWTYKPERWIVGQQGSGRGTDVALAKACFSPFSQGIRSCLGKGLAYTELTLTLASILFASEFRFADGELRDVGRSGKDAGLGRLDKSEFQLKDCIVGQKKGPWLVFKRRELIEDIS